ncbi:MAG TPA: thioredoxin-like domain-containing protein [Methylomirabilota bacterium]|nr:thioredoxin-like domain-containing protein [Methylomirabilota bacterium]
MATDLPQPRVRAPELTGGEGWLNTGRPLALADFRGRVVVLDFWTYCCINCLHVLPDLERLERKYGDALVVIGVHSAKFPNEGDSRHIEEAIARHRITHPVVNDRGFAIWHAYAVRAWPTLMVVDAEGYVVGGVSGEGHGDVLDEVVGELIEEARARGTLEPRPLPPARPVRRPTGALAYPGKIAVDEPSARVVIADSGHHRVLVATLDGRVTDVVGDGEPGATDGPLDAARFHSPQGLAVVDDLVYVADTDNHLIRTIDLAGGVVGTLAGTGEQGRGLGLRGGPALRTPLNSPWDLAVADGVLYVAMAGPHQVWAFEPDTRRIGPWAGTGREGRQDGSRWESAFAQPSGITSADDARLYVADSETSSIRAIDRRSDAVETVVGVDLFEFGDADGVGDEVRLQHPLGVAAWKGLLYVADTYNHKIKVLDPVSRRATTLAGSGRPDVFFEPGGLAVGLGWLWLADTNHHAVQLVDLVTGAVRRLALSLP